MKNRMLHYILHKTLVLVMLLLSLTSFSVFATTVRIQTLLGNIDIQLMDAAAPATVANFLNYVTSNAFDNSIIHRSVPGFIIQGGGYRWSGESNSVANISTNAPVTNEFSSTRSNLRGTIAMALLGSDPNSATSQWFFNLSDNSPYLDHLNGGYTVFGRVIDNGMQIVDAIAALRIVNTNTTNFSPPFPQLPVVTLPSASITEKNLVVISAVWILPETAASVTIPVVEYYNTKLDNYFITADASEAAAIDAGSAGAGWVRTGYSFNSGGSTPVCRFYGSQSPGPNSHFYTADSNECNSLKQIQASTPATQKRWNFESLDFVSTVPTNGTCPVGMQPVYRAYNNGFSRGVDSNHRITGSQAAIQEVVARGWSNEGIVMCALPSS